MPERIETGFLIIDFLFCVVGLMADIFTDIYGDAPVVKNEGGEER
jgi:hypothetical protein